MTELGFIFVQRNAKNMEALLKWRQAQYDFSRLNDTHALNERQGKVNVMIYRKVSNIRRT